VASPHGGRDGRAGRVTPERNGPGAVLAAPAGAATSQALDKLKFTTSSPLLQHAARHLGRRYALGFAVAVIIAAEIGMGGAQ
jgi:hypothetical protein